MTGIVQLMNNSDPVTFTDSAKRGRPRKDNGKIGDRVRSYWLVEVFVDQGWAWSTEPTEVKPMEGERACEEALPLCLGREDDIVPILKGQKPIPDDMHPRRRFVPQQILEVNGYGRIEVTFGATRLQRSRHARAVRHRQKDARRLKAREGLSFRKAHRQGKGIFVR